MGLDLPETDVARNRIEAIRKNAGWLAANDLDANGEEAAKRLGLIKGDADALIQEISDR